MEADYGLGFVRYKKRRRDGTEELFREPVTTKARWSTGWLVNLLLAITARTRAHMNEREDGLKIIDEMMDEDVARKLAASADSGTFGADVAGYAIDQAFGQVWTRPGLDRKARSLVTMAVMVALRQPNEFGIHMAIALNNGLSLREIEETIVQTLPYVGFPAVATALAAAGRVIAERGLDHKPDYSGHRGLL